MSSGKLKEILHDEDGYEIVLTSRDTYLVRKGHNWLGIYKEIETARECIAKAKRPGFSPLEKKS